MATEDKKLITVPEQSVDLASPKSLVDFATTLKRYIVEQKLYTKIKDKNYVNVEGWQFAGASTGVFPVVKSVERMDSPDEEIKYRAEVELRQVATDRTVGYGVAICSSKESKRKGSDEYVIASMAQTRATGKAYRNAFAWLMKMAGYEATPAEEMDEKMLGGEGLEEGTSDKIKEAKDVAELKKIISKLTPEQKVTAAPMINERLEELTGGIIDEALDNDDEQEA